MKNLLTIIAAVVFVGCGSSVDIHKAAKEGNIEAVKQHLAAGTDVDEKGSKLGSTALHQAAAHGRKEIAELLIAKGADVNAKIVSGEKQGLTPLDAANERNYPKIANLLRKHGAKTGEELKAAGN
jgi:ankyrin repeat protein